MIICLNFDISSDFHLRTSTVKIDHSIFHYTVHYILNCTSLTVDPCMSSCRDAAAADSPQWITDNDH